MLRCHAFVVMVVLYCIVQYLAARLLLFLLYCTVLYCALSSLSSLSLLLLLLLFTADVDVDVTVLVPGTVTFTPREPLRHFAGMYHTVQFN